MTAVSAKQAKAAREEYKLRMKGEKKQSKKDKEKRPFGTASLEQLENFFTTTEVRGIM